MTLIKMSNTEWVLIDGDTRTEGDRGTVEAELVRRLTRLLSLSTYPSGTDAADVAQEEADYAFECLLQFGHTMADFGVAGHFLRTVAAEEIGLAS